MTAEGENDHVIVWKKCVVLKPNPIFLSQVRGSLSYPIRRGIKMRGIK